ncbi:MAG: amidase [Proteobacteria bacterium]|nr:amidase [Pseudomonadota bacterium]
MRVAMTDIADWTLIEAADAIKARKISSVDVTKRLLQRIEARQPLLNAYIRVDAEGALRGAAAADAMLAAGRLLGPLHGVPLAHKDMFYRPGVTVTCGSDVRRHFKPDYLSTVLARLDAAGAVTLGALNMSEFANGPTGVNVHYGPARSPWNTSHITGGSSSGSGAAVAGRIAYGSLGSDTGGSIRLPGAIGGVYGMKPTQGRVSRYGCMGLSFSLDTIGPLARTAADCARLLTAIAGPDANDPTAADMPVADYEAGLAKGIRGMRIAVASNHYWDDMSPEIGDMLEAALGVFAAEGASVKRTEVPFHRELRGLGAIVISSEFCTLHEDWLRDSHDKYSPLVRARMKQGFGFTAVEYLKAIQVRPRITKAFVDQVFADADALFLPVLRFPVPTIAEVDTGDGERMNEVLGRLTHCTWPINYLGLPGLAVPAGFSKSGLPVGFQLIGRPFAEATLLRLASGYERVTHWPGHEPQSLPA